MTGVVLTTAVWSAHGVPVVVELYDAQLRRTETTVFVVGRRREVSVPRGAHVTMLVHTPAGHTLADRVSGADRADQEIDIGALSPVAGQLRPALTILGGPGEQAADRRAGLWLRLWSRRHPESWRVEERPNLLTSTEPTALRVRSTRPVDTSTIVQVGGDQTAWRMAVVPPGARADLLVRTAAAGPAAQPTLAVMGSDPAADALMAYLTAGRLRHAAVLADFVRENPGTAARLAVAYADLLVPATRGDEPRVSSDPDGGCDWAIVRAAELSRRMIAGDAHRIRALVLTACQTGPPVWTVGLRLLAELLRTMQESPGGLDPRLRDEWRKLRGLLATADLAAPTVTFPGTAPGEPSQVPITGVPPGAQPLPTPPRPVTVAPRHPVAIRDVTAALADLRLDVARRTPVVGRVRRGEVAASARSHLDEAGYRVAVSLSHGGDARAFQGATVGLGTPDRVVLAVVDEDGEAHFRDVPQPPWRWYFSHPAEVPAVRLPEPTPPAALAAHSESTERPEPLAITPDGLALRLTHTPATGSFQLELVTGDLAGAVLPIRYTDVARDRHTIWLPIPGPDAWRIRVLLPGRAPETPVTAETPIDIGQVRTWDAGILRESTAAALDNGTRWAWLSVLRTAGPDVAHLIDGDWLNPGPDDLYPSRRPAHPPADTRDALADLLDDLPCPVGRSAPTVVAGLLTAQITESGQLSLHGTAALNGAVVQVEYGSDRNCLVPLSAAGQARSRLPAPAAGGETRIVAVTHPARLGPPSAGLVRDSVLIASATGRDLWRRIALSRLFGDPIRVAIADALRSLT